MKFKDGNLKLKEQGAERCKWTSCIRSLPTQEREFSGLTCGKFGGVSSILERCSLGLIFSELPKEFDFHFKKFKIVYAKSPDEFANLVVKF